MVIMASSLPRLEVAGLGLQSNENSSNDNPTTYMHPHLPQHFDSDVTKKAPKQPGYPAYYNIL